MRGELQIDEDSAFQDKTWIIQRIGWVFFGALLIAAILGAFGSGLLGGRTAGSPAEGLQVHYDPLARLTAPTEIIVVVDRQRVSGNEVTLLLGGDYVEHVQLESLLPRPGRGGAHPDGATLTFDAHGDAGELRFVLQLKFNRIGALTGEVRLLGGPAVRLRHLIYP